jgi:hypothetical protein
MLIGTESVSTRDTTKSRNYEQGNRVQEQARNHSSRTHPPYPTLDRWSQVLEPGAVYVQLEVEGREVFDWVEYDLLYDAAGSRR